MQEGQDSPNAATLALEDDEPPSRRIVETPAISTLKADSYPVYANPAPIFPVSGIQFRGRSLKTRPETRMFRRRFYSSVTDKEWNDWQWQVRNRIRTYERLSRVLTLSPDETIVNHGIQLPLSITPYYLSLVSPHDPGQPIRRSVIPSIREWIKMPCESDDPLGEDNQSPVPGLVHRYPDRVLFLLLDFCSTYCRYCTRSRMVGRGGIHASRARWEKAIDYIEQTPTVRDVLLSGGDPLTLSDERLEWVLARLRRIPHVEVIRIGTKVTTVLPQRITSGLIRMLRKYHPLWMSLHFVHPDECTPETARACTMLADAGIPLGSQTVLLRDINDSVQTMTRLMHGLMKMRVRPYYLYQCDPISGSGHFRTPIDKGLEIIRGLRGKTSGYAVPTYVVDAPGGGGKIPLTPDYVAGHTNDDMVLINYENNVFRYPDPLPGNSGGQERCDENRIDL